MLCAQTTLLENNQLPGTSCHANLSALTQASRIQMSGRDAGALSGFQTFLRTKPSVVVPQPMSDL